MARVAALHPNPPPPAAAQLADAQLVVARGYGFESWAAMKRKIDSLVLSPVEQFAAALRDQEVERVRELLREHAAVRGAVNAPIGPFGSRPAAMAKTNLPLLDLLLAHGADLNLKSDWWAGGFGPLEHDCTPEQAAPLIDRGARVDIWAAAHLGMLDRTRELLEADPSLVHARGGDGKTALHCARTVDVAGALLARGAGIDARDIDHESTPAQHLVREAPDVARLLVARGAWFDIYLAVGLGDAGARGALPSGRSRGARAPNVARQVRRRPRRGPGCHGRPDARPARRHLSLDVRPQPVAARRGPPHGRRRPSSSSCSRTPRRRRRSSLLRHAPTGSRRDAIVARHPGVVASLTPEQQRLLPDKAHANDTAAVRVMIDLGFNPHARGHEHAEAIRWAAFHGNAAMTKVLLPHDPPIGVRDPTFHSTLLGWCIYGSLHGWHRETGDFAGTARLLLDAGEPLDPAALPTGRDDVDDVLREKTVQ